VRPPNTRMQRTRSSPSALRSPLMRCPLGSAKWHLVLVTAWIALASVSHGQPATREGPVLRVKASHLQYLPDMDPLWSLEVNDPGVNTLLLYSEIEAGAKAIVVTPEQIAAVREALSRERFVELKDSYGEMVLHGPERTIEIWMGGQHKRVEILTISPGMKITATERQEIGRALRVWATIRGCFGAPGGLDSRSEDEEFLATIRGAA
jgi:hypothetical protein